MKTLAKYEVKEVMWPPRTFITKRETVPFDRLTAFFTDSYRSMYAAAKQLNLRINEPPCAIYYTIDEQKRETDLAAALPVQRSVADIKPFKKISIPKSKVIMTTYYGSYENMAPAYAALEEYMTEHALKRGLILEEYFSDPGKEKDPAKWKTNIYYVIKQ